MMRSRSTVLLLATCQAIFVTGSSLVVAVSALVGLALAPDPRLATLPAGLQFLSASVTAMPASLLMRRWGRRPVFALGLGVGAAGGLTAAGALRNDSFPAFCLATVLLGVLAGVAQFYRFAAADVVATHERPRAISWVLAGGLVAAFLGPNLASVTRRAIGEIEFFGSFLALAALQLLALAVLAGIDLPRPLAEESASGGRSLSQLARQPSFVVAVLGGVVAYSCMSWLMTATPLAMGARGFAFHSTAGVIQWHLVGMFAPALFAGLLVERWGETAIMILGATLLVASAATNLAGEGLGHFRFALAALGVGWSLLFVAASSLVASVAQPSEKARAQGLNDLLVFGSVTVAATTSGTLHATIGWRAMNLCALVPAGAILALSVWLRHRRRARPRRAAAV